MADERFQDFNEKTNPDSTDELVGVDGTGYIRVPFSSINNGGLDTVKRQQWFNIFGENKPYGEDIWLGCASQSYGAPGEIQNGTMIESSKVYDWCSGGIDDYQFRTLTGMTALGYGDTTAASYTGHPRKESLAGSSWPIAKELADYFDVDVYVTHTWWSGNGIVTQFYPFIDDDGGGEGTGWTEWATQVSEAKTALSGATMDLMIFYTGDTDRFIDGVTQSMVIERYWQFTNMTKNELGVTDENTRHLFLDQPNEAIVFSRWRIYRAIFDTWMGDPRAIWGNSANSPVAEGIHPWGDAQLVVGKQVAGSMLSGGNKPTPSSETYMRPNQPPLAFGEGLCRVVDHTTQPNDYNMSMSVNAAEDELILPWAWCGELVPIGSLTYYGAPTVINILNIQVGWRLRFYDAINGDHTDYQDYTITALGPWSNSLPETAGVPNNRLFEVSKGATGGSGLPAAGTVAALTGAVNVEVFNDNSLDKSFWWPRAETDSDLGGREFTTQPQLDQGLVSTQLEQTTQLSPSAPDGTPRIQLAPSPDNIIVTPINAPMQSTEAGKLLPVQDSATGIFERRGVVVLSVEGVANTQLFDVFHYNNGAGITTCTVHLTGRRTDTPGNNALYAGTYTCTVHFNGGSSNSDIKIFTSEPTNIVNPGGQTWDYQAGAKWNNTNQIGVNGAAQFFPPSKDEAGFVYEWTADVHTITRLY